MTIVTVDMDDTLIRTGHDYTNASQQFGAFVEHEYGIDAEVAVEKQNEVDYRLLELDGLSIDRYPKSFEIALQELVDNPSDTHLSHAREIGESTFKTKSEYAERGFMPGTEQMLNCLRQRLDHLHLVTVGDPELQQLKVDALNLTNWFDDIHIPSYEQGKSAVFTDLLDTHGFDSAQFIHIGNSASSDVEPAVTIGGSSVYISSETDWLSDTDIHTEMMNHSKVHTYNEATQFIPDIPQVLTGRTKYSALNPRQI